jgi:hypothetical protein
MQDAHDKLGAGLRRQQQHTSRRLFQPVALVRERTIQTHYYSENLVAPGIEPETSVSVARNSDH